MYCSNCNIEIPNNAEYCPHCGKKNHNHTGTWDGMRSNGVALGDNSLGNNALHGYSSSKEPASIGSLFWALIIVLVGVGLGVYAFLEYSGMSLADLIEYFDGDRVNATIFCVLPLPELFVF